jgi:hypothetical protein
MTTTAVAPRRTVAPPLTRGRIVLVAAVAVTVGRLLQLVALWWARGHPEWEFHSALVLSSTAAQVAFGSQIVAYLATCSWLERSQRFARAYAPSFPHARGSTGIWLGWLFPVFSWWLPYTAVRDVRVATSRGARARDLTLLLWWLGWIAFAVSADVVRQGDDDGSRHYLLWSAVGTVGLCVALLPWLRIVRDVMADQRALVAEHSAEVAPAL